jgi:hypothetical protein
MAQGWPFAILHGASGPPPGTIRTPALKLIPCSTPILELEMLLPTICRQWCLMSAFDPLRTFLHHIELSHLAA